VNLNLISQTNEILKLLCLLLVEVPNDTQASMSSNSLTDLFIYIYISYVLSCAAIADVACKKNICNMWLCLVNAPVNKRFRRYVHIVPRSFGAGPGVHTTPAYSGDITGPECAAQCRSRGRAHTAHLVTGLGLGASVLDGRDGGGVAIGRGSV
jgi:hypothetical protein